MIILESLIDTNDEYSGYSNSGKNIEVYRILNQSAEKNARIATKCFVKGRQETLDDTIAFITNIVVYSIF